MPAWPKLGQCHTTRLELQTAAGSGKALQPLWGLFTCWRKHVYHVSDLHLSCQAPDRDLPLTRHTLPPILITICCTKFCNSTTVKKKMHGEEYVFEKLWPNLDGKGEKNASLVWVPRFFKAEVALVWSGRKTWVGQWRAVEIPGRNHFICFEVNYRCYKEPNLSVTDAFKIPDINHQLINLNSITSSGS